MTDESLFSRVRIYSDAKMKILVVKYKKIILDRKNWIKRKMQKKDKRIIKFVT